jgi:hypothetical protein
MWLGKEEGIKSGVVSGRFSEGGAVFVPVSGRDSI